MNAGAKTDTELLNEVIRLQKAENRRLADMLAKLTAEMAEIKGETSEQMQQRLIELEERLNDAKRQRFGRSSERRGRTRRKSPRSKKRKDTPVPEDAVEKQTELVALDEGDEQCNTCGGDVRAIDGAYEESRVVTRADFVYKVVTVSRQKYACTCCEHVSTAPVANAIARPLKEGGTYSADFAIAVAEDKYVSHNPLERQRRQMRRNGLRTISASTLFELLWTLSGMASPTVALIESITMSDRVLHIDETGWPVLGSRGSPGSKRWQVWHVGSESGVFFRIPPTRAHTAVTNLIDTHNWHGTIVCDGYSAYETVRKVRDVTLAACWCHARRYFVAREGEFEEATTVLDWIDELFAIERRVDDHIAEHPELDARAYRLQIRDTQSRSVVQKIHEWALQTKSLKTVGLGPGLQYLANHWRQLKVFLDDAAVPLSNLVSERNLRPAVVGRKNFYGARSQRGTLVAAAFYTIRETAALYGIEFRDYMRAIVKRHAEDPDAGVHPGEVSDILAG